MHEDKEESEKLIKKFFLKCQEDFFFFCRKSLKIRNKEASIVNLEVNSAQKLIHNRLQQQLKTRGYVRAIILKGRQQGVSTYVQARFLWKLLHSKGIKAFILTHVSSATKNIFDITKRYVDGLPVYKPDLGTSNVNEMMMLGTDCGYKVGTALSKGVGRSDTIQLFHGSEVAYWNLAQNHLAGIFQTVPDAKGTEIILESTANGVGNIFHEMCMKAQANKNDFELIFIPWTMQKEYSFIDDEPISLTEEEEYLMAKYELTLGQIKFRRKKISQLGDVRRFRQEYPLSIEDAFISDSETSFITATEIEKATVALEKIKSDQYESLILGIDPSGKGKDHTGYALRSGRILAECDVLPKRIDTMEQVGDITRLIDRINPDKIFIDIGGVGAPIYDRLRERGYRNLIGINFGERPDDMERYANKRSEMYDRIKRWFNEPPCYIPNNKQLEMELTMVEEALNSSGKLKLTPKRNMAYSPNLADAFALTFAQIITKNNYKKQDLRIIKTNIDWDPFSI